MKLTLKHAIVVFGILPILAACGGGGGDDTTRQEPTAYQSALAAIQAAETPEAAEAAYDAVKDDVTASEGEKLQAAVDSRKDALATMARIEAQKAALMTAAAGIDTSNLSDAAAIAAARTAIMALEMALAGAVDVSDADKAMYQSRLDAANSAVDMAQGALDTQGRMTAQRMAIDGAVEAASTAVNGIGNESSDGDVEAAEAAIMAVKDAIDAAADLSADDNTIVVAKAKVAVLGQQLMTAKDARMAHLEAETARKAAEAEADRKAAEEEAARKAAAMAATAAKLYAGIKAPVPLANLGEASPTFTANDLAAAYNEAETAILVAIGDGSSPATEPTATLSLDKDTTVATNHGWVGKRYADPAGGDSYEAVVYSNVEAPKMGRKFGSSDPVTPTGAYEYQLTSGALPSTSFVAANVSFTGVTRTAGLERFNLPDPNPSGADIINIPGSYHGVSGTYNCTPATAADGCSASVAVGGGFAISENDTWTFTPSNAEARVMDSEDTNYASYGWWLHKTENGQKFTASAFHDIKGTVPDATGLNDLNGTATYRGSAAGKYALASSTGGTNDAGHFTARATLEANFDVNTSADSTTNGITGTIDQFIGADGQSRNWEVKLNGSPIGDTGAIGDSTANDGTVWTINGAAAASSGQWSGTLRNNGGDGVPQVATGTFYSEYGTAGRMVGGFGANEDD